MNGKYFFYALCVTLFSTILSWSSMFSSMGNYASGSTWSSGSRGYGSGSGGGHK